MKYTVLSAYLFLILLNAISNDSSLRQLLNSRNRQRILMERDLIGDCQGRERDIRILLNGRERVLRNRNLKSNKVGDRNLKSNKV